MKRVMCFGTFDGLHRGHLSYFDQAARNGDELMVVVALGVNVKKIKGSEPLYDDEQRLLAVADSDLVDLAIMGHKSDKYAAIRRYRPNVICLGYDQWVDMRGLLSVHSGDIIRVLPYKKDVYKSSKINKSK